MSYDQIMPARAKKKTLVPMGPQVLTEQKIDGQRYLIHSDGECTSRRISEVTQRFVEKGDRVPHIIERAAMLPSGTILDSEMVASADIVPVDLPGHLWDKCVCSPYIKSLGYLPAYPHVSATTAIMGSAAGLAIKKQEKGLIWAYVFDILKYNGKWTTRSSQAGRRKFLESLTCYNRELVVMPQWPSLTADEQLELYELVVAVDGEGLIFKDPGAQYNAPSNWWKWKKDFPVDAVLTGNYTWGKGKLSNLLGALEIGVYSQGKLVSLAYISAIMDSETKLIQLTADRNNLRGLVVECRHNGKQKKNTAPLGFTIRHPRFRRWRDDKNAEDCTLEALLCEL